MKLWRRASGALKDINSILAVRLSSRHPHRNPDIESAIIKATSHDESSVDYKNAQRIFAWIHLSPMTINPLIFALSRRMEKTQCWVVAVKGLVLIHGVFCCKTPPVQRIGRLPFDLSSFTDGHSKPYETWGFNAFVRAYFSFLDQRNHFLYNHHHSQKHKSVMLQELVRLQNWQSLLDILLQVRPLDRKIKSRLILEALECVIIEIFDLHSRICNGIARILLGIYGVGKPEASVALEVFQKATTQSEDLTLYFESCRDFGVYVAKELPIITKVPEEEIRNLELIITNLSHKSFGIIKSENVDDNDKATVVRDEVPGRKLRTIITEKWETFEGDMDGCEVYYCNQTYSSVNPFIDIPSNHLQLVPVTVYKHDVPDLISL